MHKESQEILQQLQQVIHTKEASRLRDSLHHSAIH